MPGKSSTKPSIVETSALGETPAGPSANKNKKKKLTVRDPAAF
jgi:hypothetical protein